MALFKSWFIDYEPFELNDDGFPSDWEQTTLDKKLTTSTQSVNPQKIQGDYVWHYSIPAFDNEKLPTKDNPTSILSNKYLVPDNAILVSKLNPDTKRIWRTMSCFENAICSTEFIVFSPLIPSHRAFYYLMFNTKGFVDFLVSNATGSTNSRMRVKPTSSLDYEFVCPSDAIIEDFCKKVEPLLIEIEKNTLEIRKLNELKPFAVAILATVSITINRKLCVSEFLSHALTKSNAISNISLDIECLLLINPVFSRLFHTLSVKPCCGITANFTPFSTV